MGQGNNRIEQKRFIEIWEKKYQETGKEKYLHLQIIVEFEKRGPSIVLDEHKQILRDYILKVASWTNYELFLFSYYHFLLSHEEIKGLYKQMYQKLKNKNEQNRISTALLMSF
ncbi:Rgg family transcriptional regulator [Enterococcus olivae]